MGLKAGTASLIDIRRRPNPANDPARASIMYQQPTAMVGRGHKSTQRRSAYPNSPHPHSHRQEATHIGPRLHNGYPDDATATTIDARYNNKEKVSYGRRGAHWPTASRAAPDVTFW